jgi:2,2-dialkylglycine decarboxylase (pyruvate)
MDYNYYLDLANRYLLPLDYTGYGCSSKTPVIVKANGARLTDIQGNEYLDFNSGQMGAALGHNHPLLVQSVIEAFSRVTHCAKHLLHPPQVLLAKEIAEIVDKPLSRSMFLLSGTDATSAALIMASCGTGGTEFAAMEIGYHGGLGIAGALSFVTMGKGLFPSKSCHSLMAPYCYRCPLGTAYPACGLGCLERDLDQLRAIDGRLAGVIVEPVMSAGGVVEAPHGFLKGLASGVRRLGGLFVLDESQTGLGKLGTMFGYQQHGVIPDILVLGKHFGAGVPISAVVTTDHIASECAAKGFLVVGSHFSDPMACAAGLASLEIIKREQLINRAKTNGEYTADYLRGLMTRYEIIGDIRGRGGLFGVELVKDRNTKAPAQKEAAFVARRCLELGLVIGVRGASHLRNVLRIVPPLVCDQDTLAKGFALLDQALGEVQL